MERKQSQIARKYRNILDADVDTERIRPIVEIKKVSR